MITDKQKAIIENNPVSLGTVTANNKPNLIVVASVKVFDDYTVVITDNYMSQTLEDLGDNKSVCLVCWDKGQNGVKIIGEASYSTEGKWLDYVKSLKENDGFPAKGAVVVTVTKMMSLK